MNKLYDSIMVGLFMSVTVGICLMGIGIYSQSKKQNNIEPPKPSLVCIEGYEFLQYNNSYTQILDSNGNGIKCK